MGDAVDLDVDIVLPLLQPILSSVSLPEVSKRTQELVIKAVGLFRGGPLPERSLDMMFAVGL